MVSEGARDGALQMRAVAARLKQLGADGGASTALPASFGKGRTLRAQLLGGIRAGAKPAVEAARQAAIASLPKKNGLNRAVAKKVNSRTRLTGPRVGVRVRAAQGWGQNRGDVWHPTWGHRDRSVHQPVPAASGWFDDTLRKEVPATVVPIRAAMESVAAEAMQRL